MAKPQKITEKQTAFADCVARGMTLSDSYRKAYNAGHMANSTIHANACRLGANSKVITMVDQVLLEMADEKRISQLSNRVKVLNKLTELMDDKTAPKAVQLNAAVWLGKTDALFTDVQETKDTTQDLDAIDKEISARIKELSGKT